MNIKELPSRTFIDIEIYSIFIEVEAV